MAAHTLPLLLLIIVFDTAFAQTFTIYPLCTNNLSFNVPYIYVETLPSTNSPWSVCIRAEPCQGLTTRETAPIVTINGAEVELKVTFREASFGICPAPTIHRVQLPPVPQPGPIRIRYLNRYVPAGQNENINAPFFFRQQITTQAFTPVPMLNLGNLLILTFSVMGVGVVLNRRR